AASRTGTDGGLGGAGLRGRSLGHTNLNGALQLSFPVGGEHGANAGRNSKSQSRGQLVQPNLLLLQCFLCQDRWVSVPSPSLAEASGYP
ncbi:hypothetical protein LEMLEM_LOCUS24689, partial [Lemmus lemmus]